MRLAGLTTSAVALLLAACGVSQSATTAAPQAGSPSGRAADAFPVADAILTGPITGGLHGHALWDSWYDMSQLGYDEAEYFVSGTATQQPDGPSAPYTTRIIVWHPREAKDFNGTVVIDWVNVTAQFENPVDTLEAHAYLQRHGYAFVHASIQKAGLCCTPLTPQVWDPVRYATLSHPGDAYAFDMLAQIAKALRAPAPGSADATDGLHVRRVLAMGQSQSAIELHDYVNLGYARSRVIDGILIHGDVGSGKQFAELPVPVVQLLSDNEAAPEAPTATQNYALWEIAGTGHTDMYVGLHQIEGQGPRTLGDAPKQPASADTDLHASVGNYGEQPTPYDGACVAAGESFPMRYAVDAALDYLNRWDGAGNAAPSGPRFAFDATGALARDSYTNALGGIRYPPIDVPVASYVSTACPLGGFTVPFSEVQLAVLYPTHADYFCKMQAATRASVMAGFLLPEDADDLMARVEGAKNRWLDAGVRDCP